MKLSYQELHNKPRTLHYRGVISSSDNSLQLGAIAKIFLEFSPEAPHAPEAPEAHSNRNYKCLTELDINPFPLQTDRPRADFSRRSF